MKVQIDIRDEIPVELAIDAVQQVIQEGKVSTGKRKNVLLLDHFVLFKHW